MKKTNEDILKFFGLKIGDTVKLYNRCFKVGTVGGVLTLGTTPLLGALVGNEYEVLSDNLGDRACADVPCDTCPLRHLDCGCNDPTMTLSQILDAFKDQGLNEKVYTAYKELLYNE